MARSTTGRKVLLALGATLAMLALAEIAVRLLVRPRPPRGQFSYQTADGQPITGLTEAMQRGYVVMVDTAENPRGRGMFRPGLDFDLCYADGEELGCDWLDSHGCVSVHINAAGIRDDDDIGFDKPPAQRRIVCLGDSFTFGWGVRPIDGWVDRLEAALRAEGRDVRTVNCGAAGTLCVDEYQWGLEHRFHRFQPDVVVVTICLNDLIPSSGLFVQGPAPDTGVRLLDLALRAAGRTPLELDPGVDWVGYLLSLRQDAAEAAGLAGHDKPFAAMWSQDAPQRALRAMQAWCSARKLPFLVVLWPFLQGLGPGRHYPFAALHAMVAADCAAAGIPFLDVLPALAGTPAEELWVTPADMHANPRAHALATPSIVEFVRAHAAL